MSSEFGALLEGWARCWSVPSLPRKVSIEFSPRIRRSLGRCNPREGSIRLHPALRDEPGTLLEEVLCHEAAHAAVYLIHGRGVRPHGPEWAALMRRAGFEPRARMSPDQLSERFQGATSPRIAYLHRCPVCQAQRLAGRAVRRWRCRVCVESGRDGRLEISRQPYAGRGSR